MLLTEQDIYHFREGTYVRAYEKLGAHVIRATEGALHGTRFAVWAPNAAAAEAQAASARARLTLEAAAQLPRREAGEAVVFVGSSGRRRAT